eukprot:TRINITY_DN72649_c0_g1_i1.p1 TRINITY_DN72649_c0_g1~~TRINITY_DN72649_c0_g1_i1.p1  ORF type:complete len:237 (-),score=13.76 TRINITY_DN72649_c0_g1_i1:96-806(-)
MSVVPNEATMEPEYFVKLLMLGDSGVGKSCLTARFSDGKFPLDILGTAGIDCKERTLSVSGKITRVQIWDTAGQERYSILTETYYKKAFGIVVVYDITDADSFKNVDTWMKNIKEKCNKVVEIILVGNKSDLAHKRAVPADAGAKLAAKYGIQFLEGSAKDGTNVEKAFASLTESILNNKELVKHCLASKMEVISISKKRQYKGGMCEQQLTQMDTLAFMHKLSYYPCLYLLLCIQ